MSGTFLKGPMMSQLDFLAELDLMAQMEVGQLKAKFSEEVGLLRDFQKVQISTANQVLRTLKKDGKSKHST